MTFANCRSKNAHLGFTQSLANSGYLWFVFHTLSHYCSSYPHFRGGSRKGNQYLLYNFLLEHYLALLNYILYSTLIM
ncbi:hypothetical protein BDD12DRAFT_947877 [Trichophaea hybrida]|nr:hypothetical protein BDD12DRAFT_947877 [Trichophaea hybrida]